MNIDRSGLTAAIAGSCFGAIAIIVMTLSGVALDTAAQTVGVAAGVTLVALAIAFFLFGDPSRSTPWWVKRIMFFAMGGLGATGLTGLVLVVSFALGN